MRLTPGVRLGRYEVVRAIGPGGVYLARDSERRRDVALRLVDRDFPTSEARLQFKRVVTSLSTLAHPSIAGVYGIESIVPGTRVLVTEYVDGRSLLECIAGGAMPLEEALAIARQVATRARRLDQGHLPLW
jgi:eukaryotic-like serine/threonine-protein kinase